MPQVQVPGVGPLNFPDGMPQEEMATAIEKNYGPQMRAQRNPEDVTAGMALRGIPLVGAYVPQAEAAIRAATGQGQGGTFAERYANLVPEREAQYAQAERESPISSGLLQAGGGTVALAPVGATALGARVLGSSGGLLSRTALGGASGAGISAADAYLRGQDPTTAAMIGGGIGAAAAPIASGVSRAISPFVQSPERAAATQLLKQEGVTSLTAGQKTGSPIKWAEAQLGDISGATTAMLESQQKQFTRAAAKRGGIIAEDLTPETINDALENWGKQRETLASKTGLFGQNNLSNTGRDLQQIVDKYAALTGGQPAPTPEKYFNRFMQLQQDHGSIPGKEFGALTSDMATSARMTSNAGEQMTLNNMRNRLFDAMEHQTKGTPNEGQWRQLNQQYRNLLALKKAAANPTEATALAGTISPSQLYRGIGGKDYARDYSDLAELARAGLAVMKPLPSSGTAQRLFYSALPGALAGGAYNMATGESPFGWGTLAGGVGTLAGGRAVMNPYVQRYLANQVVPRTFQFPGYAAPVAGAFMGGNQ